MSHTTRTIYRGYFQLEGIVIDDNPELEIVRTTDSVAVLIEDQTADRFILVRQLRPSQIRPDNPFGHITELAAGRFDSNYTVRQLMAKEVLEETGLNVAETDFLILNGGNPVALSAGVITERSYLGYVRLNIQPDQSADERTYGLTTESESIHRISLSRSDVARYLQGGCEDIRVFALLTWALNQRRD